ncbi:MAG TPA: DUF5668 domain-containing protein [Candidatus Dormibacteraeota bacterium]|nr:DUF5668 domain-containing protein [Candidatus Dormibacteraeota bacterium]
MSRRRGVSGLGLLLVLVGTVILLVSFSKLPRSVDELWPLILVGVGLVGLLRRPGWIEELDLAVPGAGEAVPGARRAHAERSRPRRGFSLFLIGSGLFLLLLTAHVVDQRLIGPGLLIALGLLLLWRRSR